MSLIARKKEEACSELLAQVNDLASQLDLKHDKDGGAMRAIGYSSLDGEVIWECDKCLGHFKHGGGIAKTIHDLEKELQAKGSG